METKKPLRALATIVACLVIIFSAAPLSGALADGVPVKKYHADVVNKYSEADLMQSHIYTYDCGNMLSYLFMSLEDGIFRNNQLHTYTNDENGNRMTDLYQKWNTVLNEWENNSQTTFTYDADGHKSTELLEKWNLGLNAWGNSLFSTYAYDAEGKLLTVLQQKWTTMWVNYTLRTYSYDSDGHLTSILAQTWLGASWSGVSIQTYTYDGDGNLLVDLLTFYNNYMVQWIRNTYTYYDDGSCASKENVVKMFNVVTPVNYFLYTNDENGNILTIHTHNWVGGVWKNKNFQTFSYEAEGNCLGYVLQLWNGTEWYNSLKVLYDYQSGAVSGQTYQWISEEWVPGGNANMELAIVDDGHRTIFGTANDYFAEAIYSQELLAEASPYQTVYYGYPPQACATVSVTASGGVEPYTYMWNNGETTVSFEVCPLESAAYSVTVTDADGCTAVSSTRVCMADVRCGKNLDKVMLCHCPPGNPNNCNTLCVSVEDVPDHLAHGDLLGACGVDYTCTDLKVAPADVVVIETEEGPFIRACPNPAGQSAMISYLVDQPGKVSIWLTNSYGQTVRALFTGYSPDQQIQYLQAGTGDLKPGVYLLILQQANGSMITEKLVVQR